MVPEGWEPIQLGEVVLDGFRNGYSPNPPEQSTDRHVLSLSALTPAGLDSRALKPAPNEEAVLRSELVTGDFLISRSNTRDRVGFTALYRGEVPNCSYPDLMMRFRPDDQKVVPEFLEQTLRSSMTLSYLQGAAAGTSASMVKLNSTSVAKAPLWLPPLAEQRKIAEILSTWDAAIEKMEALLANARTQKRALMQSLLTGKRRFPEFDGRPWKEVRLGELGSFKKGKGLPKTEVGSVGQFPCVLYGELYTTYGEIIDQPKSRTDLNDGIVSMAGDVLIPASTTTSGKDLAIASCVMTDGVRLGGDMNIFRRKTDAIDGAFLAFFLTHVRRYEMARFAQGITIVHLKGSDLLDISVSVPPKPEQVKILTVVRDVEDQIAGYHVALGKLRTEKKALMQQLLTGKRRVLV